MKPPFPVISVEGSPYEIGYQYGSQAKAFIEETLGTYRSIFKREAKLDWAQVIEIARKFTPFIESYDPDAIDEMSGLAKAINRSLEEIIALSARSELAFLALTKGMDKTTEGCTALAVTPEATRDSHTLIGQNWDWVQPVQKSLLLLKKKKKGKPNCITFVEAGLLGRGGLNSAGLGFVGNGLVTDKTCFGVPTSIITNKMLSAESLTEAMGMLLSARRASSTNRLTASSDGQCVDIEVSTEEYNVIFPEDGTIAHTNHFLVFHPNVKDVMPIRYPNSFTRLHRARKLLAAERPNITVETFKRILTDHSGRPNSICWHLDEKFDESHRIQTNASVIMDLNDKTFLIAKGPPCENEYVPIDARDIL